MNAIGWTEGQSLRYLFPLIISISFAMDVFVPAIPVMSHFFNISDNQMQASLYVFMLTVAFGELCVGPLADRYGRRHICILTALLFLTGSLFCAFAGSITILLLGRIIQAAGACGTYLLCFIIIRDNFQTNACARLFSILCGINAMVASTAPVIGGFLLDFTGDWHSGFYFLGGLGIVMTFIVLRSIPDYAYPKPEFPFFQTAKGILSNRDFRKYTMIASVSLLGLYLFCALSPGILIKKLHLAPSTYGLWFGLNAITVFLTNILAARLTYIYPLKSIVFFGLVWMIFSCILMLALNFYQISVLRFMLPMLSLTIGISLSMGTSSALALKDFQEQAGTATSFLGAGQFGLAGLSGIVVAQWTPEPSLLALPVLCFSLMVCRNLWR